MSTVSAIFPNAVTPSSTFVRNRDNLEDKKSNIEIAFEETSFTPVDENQQVSNIDNRAQQKPEQDLAAQRFTDLQQQRITAERLDENLSDAAEKKLDQQQQQQLEQQLVEEQKIIRNLSERDREVKAHEQAHVAVGGQYAGTASYEYKRGPDGVNYAVSGEVDISLSKLADPYMTIDKMKQVKQAALAPAEPSAQDYAVAAKATQIELEAYTEIAKLKQQEEQAKEDENKQTDNNSDKQENNLIGNKPLDQTASDEEKQDKQKELINQLQENTQIITEQAMAVQASKNPQQNVGLNLDIII